MIFPVFLLLCASVLYSYLVRQNFFKKNVVFSVLIYLVNIILFVAVVLWCLKEFFASGSTGVKLLVVLVLTGVFGLGSWAGARLNTKV